MKLITKKCPNCGANLSISEEDKKVTCEYCKQQIFIEKDKNNFSDSEIHLRLEKHGVKILNGVIIFIFGVTFFSIILFMIFFFKIFNFGTSQFEDINSSINNSGILKENTVIQNFKEIDEEQLEGYHKDSIHALNNQAVSPTSNAESTEWKYYGTYFLAHKQLDTNEMYDIFTKTYTIDGKEITIYAPVMYRNLELSDGEVTSIIPGFVRVPVECVYGDMFNCINGYADIEALYRDLIRNKKSTHTISGTNGIYLK